MTNLGKYFSADGVERGRQAHALAVHFLLKGVDPAKLVALLVDLGARDASKIIEAAQRAMQYKRTSDVAGALSSDCLAAAAAVLDVPFGRTFVLHVGEQIRAIPIPTPLVRGRFIQDSLVFVMGEPGAGKTFWTLSLDAAIATAQRTWMNEPIHRDMQGGTIVYALAEGVGQFQLRLMGALQQLRLTEVPDSFIFVKQSLHLSDLASIESFIKAAAPYQPCVVTVDTYQRHGGPETEEEKVSQAIEHLTLIKEELGCTVFGLHHLPKDGRQTPRGHGAIDGSIDTAVYLTRDENSIITARFEQRELEPSVFSAQSKIVEIAGYVDDETGLLRTTCVLEPCSPQKTQRVSTTAKKEQELSKALIAAVSLNPGINQGDLCKAVGGNKKAAISEIDRLVGTGQLTNKQTTGKGGRVVNHFELGPVPF
jgi:hypothetical protein